MTKTPPRIASPAHPPGRLPPAPLLHDFLEEAARRRPAREALAFGRARTRYGELDEGAGGLAAALADRGVGRGDRVLILAPSGPAAALAFWAALKASAVPAIAGPHTRRAELADLLRDCRPRAVIAHPSLGAGLAEPVAASPGLAAVFTAGGPAESSGLPGAESLAVVARAAAGRAPPPRRAIDRDLAAVLYTPGPAGRLRGVMHTHASARAAALAMAARLELAESDAILTALPLSRDDGLCQLTAAAAAGARVVLERSSAYPRRLLATAERERVTGLPGVPALFGMLRERGAADFDLASVRYVASTAAPLASTDGAFLAGAFPGARVHSMYGRSECQRVAALPPERLEDKPGSVGWPLPGSELWVAGEGGRPLAAGEVGQIVVRGATLMQGYWGMPEATARSLGPGPVAGERVLYTGDLGVFDDEGFLYVLGAGEATPDRRQPNAPRRGAALEPPRARAGSARADAMSSPARARSAAAASPRPNSDPFTTIGESSP